jgi:hypothetical protein
VKEVAGFHVMVCADVETVKTKVEEAAAYIDVAGAVTVMVHVPVPVNVRAPVVGLTAHVVVVLLATAYDGVAPLETVAGLGLVGLCELSRLSGVAHVIVAGASEIVKTTGVLEAVASKDVAAAVAITVQVPLLTKLKTPDAVIEQLGKMPFDPAV